jgi:hypothetical protein
MTKKELLEMIKNYNDNEELAFVYEDRDRDGYPVDEFTEKVYKVVKKNNYKKVKEQYGIVRIYNA